MGYLATVWTAFVEDDTSDVSRQHLIPWKVSCLGCNEIADRRAGAHERRGWGGRGADIPTACFRRRRYDRVRGQWADALMSYLCGHWSKAMWYEAISGAWWLKNWRDVEDVATLTLTECRLNLATKSCTLVPSLVSKMTLRSGARKLK